MSSTQAEAAVMAQVAAKFSDAQETLAATLSALLREVEDVRQAWQGKGGTSFQAVTAAWGRDQERLLGALAETAEAIGTAGRAYTATDDQAASRLQHQSINLPL